MSALTDTGTYRTDSLVHLPSDPDQRGPSSSLNSEIDQILDQSGMSGSRSLMIEIERCNCRSARHQRDVQIYQSRNQVDARQLRAVRPPRIRTARTSSLLQPLTGLFDARDQENPGARSSQTPSTFGPMLGHLPVRFPHGVNGIWTANFSIYNPMSSPSSSIGQAWILTGVDLDMICGCPSPGIQRGEIIEWMVRYIDIRFLE